MTCLPLSSPWVHTQFFGGVRVADCLVFCVVSFALSLSCVFWCTIFCQCLWIFNSWLPLRFSFTFIYLGESRYNELTYWNMGWCLENLRHEAGVGVWTHSSGLGWCYHVNDFILSATQPQLYLGYMTNLVTKHLNLLSIPHSL